MQIQLKQPEIAAALRLYLVTQGIALAGKSVTIGFTAGRKEGGLTADINIEDAAGEIPGFTDATGDEEAPAKPALSVVKTEAAPEAEEPPATVDDTPAESPVKATTSLFG